MGSKIEVGSLSSFSRQAVKFADDLEEYKKTADLLDKIGDDAVIAAGGPDTALGQTILSSFQETNSEEMKTAIDSLDKLLAGVKHINKLMWEAYENAIAAVKSVTGE